MSIFNEILEQIDEISNGFNESIKKDLQDGLDSLNKFAEEYLNAKSKGRDASQNSQKNKNALTTLQSINEDEDDQAKVQDTKQQNNKRRSSNKLPETLKDVDNNQPDETQSNRTSKKRSKEEVDEMSSPEKDKRPKRSASVKAQGNISKQQNVKQWWQILSENDQAISNARKVVNVNLSTKMRREEQSSQPGQRESRRRGKKDEGSDKENEPTIVQVKQEPMDWDLLPIDIKIKQEPTEDDIAMPPPAAPVPKTRGRPAKNKYSKESKDSLKAEVVVERGRNRSIRNRKETDTMPHTDSSVAAIRSTRSSSRTSSRNTMVDDPPPPPPQESRPKRTRAKKKASDTFTSDTDKEPTQENSTVTPEKPRPKRTRRGQKAAEKEAQKQLEESSKQQNNTETTSPKEERISEPQQEISSPILNKKTNNKLKKNTQDNTLEESVKIVNKTQKNTDNNKEVNMVHTEERQLIVNMNVTVDICNGDMDKTIILPNGKFNHVSGTPTKKGAMNETVVLETASMNRETMLLDKQPLPMDATVILEKEPHQNITDDNSILTDDNSEQELQESPETHPQPTSAVKEKVQQFEEMASRVTRTKTRAMAKKEDTEETQTPPDKVGKPVLSAETLTKMNSLIFNGKTAQISTSASKPRTNIVSSVKSFIPSSASKLSSMSRHKEAEESMKKEKEDARKKKEAMLEAKKEAQKRKREDKMAAAAAAREAAEKERALALQALAKERKEKQLLADRANVERMKEAERKKQELARKVAETEERRRAEEKARQQRLADEQKRAEIAKKLYIEEQDKVKKEAALMQKEIEKRQKEYNEKQKLKKKNDKLHTPLKPPGQYPALEPVYMQDGFQQLNSDDDEDEPSHKYPVPAWSSSKVRWHQLTIQSHIAGSHIDRLFSCRVHSPDLREIFPNIERRALVRTSSAVWRTPT